MAKEVSVRLLDDMEEGKVEADAGTVTFGLDDKTYEIDLSTANAVKIHSQLAPWIANARLVKTGRKGATNSKPAQGKVGWSPSGDLTKDQRNAVREWADRQGIPVAPRGRIGADVITAFELAHPSQ